MGGVLFGTAGVKVLGSTDAKKIYINCLAAGLRAKDCVMTTATNIQENAEDILADIRVDSTGNVWYFVEKHKIDDRICAERHTKIDPYHWKIRRKSHDEHKIGTAR